MIEVYTKKNKKFMTFNTSDVTAVKNKLRQLNIIKTIKYLLLHSYTKLCTYYCANCKKRTYVEEASYDPSTFCCTHCNTDNKLFFVGFKQSQTQVTHKYAL